MDGYSVDDTYLEIDHEIEQESDIIKIKLKKMVVLIVTLKLFLMMN